LITIIIAKEADVMSKYTLDAEMLTSLINCQYSSLREASKAMDIHHSYLCKVLNKKQEPGKKFIEGVLAAFKDLKFEDIFKKSS
jgi:hypothetical protein